VNLPLGTLVNGAAVIVGSLAGLSLRGRYPDRVRSIVFTGIGLATLIIGLQMALKMDHPLIVIFSLVLGGAAGALCDLEGRFDRLGETIKRLLRSRDSLFTDGFVTASLLYCVGSMAILGSIEEGLRGDATILYTKSMLDGFASVALASTFGAGALLAFVPVVLYQGALTLCAFAVKDYATANVITELTAVGGTLIAGIGINLLGLARLSISNLLPALAVAAILALFLPH
jgi:uncharacterized protein